MVSKTDRILKQFAPKRAGVATIGGETLEIPNHSGDNSAGTVLKTPVNEHDIANKKYVDNVVAGGGITNLEGGNSTSNFGGVAISPIDGGDST